MSMNEEKRANESACTATSAPRGIVVPADVVVLLMLQPPPRPWTKNVRRRAGAREK